MGVFLAHRMNPWIKVWLGVTKTFCLFFHCPFVHAVFSGQPDIKDGLMVLFGHQALAKLTWREPDANRNPPPVGMILQLYNVVVRSNNSTKIGATVKEDRQIKSNQVKQARHMHCKKLCRPCGYGELRQACLFTRLVFKTRRLEPRGFDQNDGICHGFAASLSGLSWGQASVLLRHKNGSSIGWRQLEPLWKQNHSSSDSRLVLLTDHWADPDASALSFAFGLRNGGAEGCQPLEGKEPAAMI